MLGSNPTGGAPTSEQPSDKILLPFTQAGKRATRVINLGSGDLLHDSFKHWFQLRDRENRMPPEERAKIRDSAAFFDKVLEKLPQFRQSLIHGDFSHRALEGAGPSMINSLIEKVRKIKGNMCSSSSSHVLYRYTMDV